MKVFGLGWLWERWRKIGGFRICFGDKVSSIVRRLGVVRRKD